MKKCKQEKMLTFGSSTDADGNLLSCHSKTSGTRVVLEVIF